LDISIQRGLRLALFSRLHAGLSSDAKCNPRRFGIGKIVRDLKERSYSRLSEDERD